MWTLLRPEPALSVLLSCLSTSSPYTSVFVSLFVEASSMADTHQPFRLPQQSKRENPRLILQNNNPQLSSTFQHTPVHQLHCPDQNPNPAGFVNNEGVHVVGPSSSSFSFPSCGDHSLYSIQNVKDLDHRFSFGADAVSLSLAPHHRHERCAPPELNPKRYDVVSVRGGTPKPNNELRSSVPLGPFTGYASILKRSSFLSPAQQLLEDFCGVGRRVSDSASFDPPVEGSGTAEDPIGCGHGSEHCWKSSRLAPMLDEVYRRYKLYCQQMHSIVASFETVAGLQNAAPYISFAFKAMSKHFRYLKNAILDQIQFTGKTLIGHNIGKDETPRVWTADQGFHSQKAVQNSIFLQHPVWRSQRGLPDQAVAVLRAWLFEHFLHPYPTDLEKQILAQQTSLSRNQVSNWFINARVRLWKPMVEEILMLETKQAQMAAEGEANKPTDRLPSANPIPLGKPFQNTPTQKMEDAQSKRSRNKLYYMFEQRDEQTNLPYNNFSSNYQMGVSGIEKSASKGISLALGLHQNKGIESSRSFSVNMSHHFGLETNSQQYLRNGSEARNQNSGKDLRAHLLHDFASRSIPFNSNA